MSFFFIRITARIPAKISEIGIEIQSPVFPNKSENVMESIKGKIKPLNDCKIDACLYFPIA